METNTAPSTSLEAGTNYHAIVEWILDLTPDMWYDAAKGAIEKEKSIGGPKAAKLLKKEITSAMDAATKNQEVIAQILRKAPDLDPSLRAFMYLRIIRLAELIKEKPDMVDILKIQAQNQSYNVGLKHHIETINIIASDPGAILSRAEELKNIDDEQDLKGECSFREIYTALAWYVDKYNAQICAIWEDWKSIPVKGGVMGEGRPVRKRVSKKLD